MGQGRAGRRAGFLRRGRRARPRPAGDLHHVRAEAPPGPGRRLSPGPVVARRPDRVPAQGPLVALRLGDGPVEGGGRRRASSAASPSSGPWCSSGWRSTARRPTSARCCAASWTTAWATPRCGTGSRRFAWRPSAAAGCWRPAETARDDGRTTWLRLIRHPTIQLLIAADRLAADLAGGRHGDVLARRLPRGLIFECGRVHRRLAPGTQGAEALAGRRRSDLRPDGREPAARGGRRLAARADAPAAPPGGVPGRGPLDRRGPGGRGPRRGPTWSGPTCGGPS